MPCVAALQMTSGTDTAKNLAEAAKLIAQAVDKGAELVVLPELFPLFSLDEQQKLTAQETAGHGPIQDFLAQQAQQQGIWIVGGTLPLRTSDPQKSNNSCLVFNSAGQAVARYDKIHLFDANVKPGVETYVESASTQPGDKVVVVETPVGKLGLAVCYDVRFPELFRALSAQGAQIFAIPTAFTVTTGIAHWEVLLRARAIENFCYAIGACQGGAHENGRQTYGHSMIVNPWGTIVSRLDNQPGVITAEIDLDQQSQIRQDFPVLNHQRLTSII